MRRKKRVASLLLPLLLAVMASLTAEARTLSESPSGRGAAAIQDEKLHQFAQERDIPALIYLDSEHPIRREPRGTADTVALLPSGQTVYILDASRNEPEKTLWLYVRYERGGETGYGYVERQYLACGDERFLGWEEEVLEDDYLSDDSVIISSSGVSADVAQFPESYQAGLQALKDSHPKWVFVPMETDLGWNTVITEELNNGRSLVYKSFPECSKEGAYDDGNWYYASREILEYYMDPRNAMTEARIFQFELLTYNSTYHTEEAVESFLNNTFMKSSAKAPGTNMTYAHIFWAVGSEKKISPFHLAARVYQEQGQGTSALISGTYAGYKGYYNYFNVGATGTTTTQVIESGLKYAKEHGWDSAYTSIEGGAGLLAANYISKGQDTLYLEKFNVNPSAAKPLYSHQYMQNISAPASEGSSIKKLYENAESLDNSFVFKIPVFKDMPASACPYLTSSTNVVLKLPAGYDATVWVGGVPCPSETRADSSSVKRTIVKAPDAKATSAVVYAYNSDKVPNGMYVWTLDYTNNCYKAAAQDGLKDLLSYHGFSVRISGDAGMRMKTGIAAATKNSLTGSGVNGFKLKEYGTLVTEREDLSADPLVAGGEGVLAGVSYGTDASGKKVDVVYETVSGRQRFTAVLTNVPVEKYRTVYSFRGYIILSKDGKNYTIYGPLLSRSMEGLANQILKAGTYPKGSDEDIFLRKIISDAKQ